jgi:V/A-type H+/Na+-transporting ATPase subunit K
MTRNAALVLFAAALVVLFATVGLALSQEQPNREAGSPAAAAAQGEPKSVSQSKPEKGGINAGLIAMAAALAVGICALGTGLAQSRIGAAGAGSIAEKPETVGSILLLVAIPETMIILGFVVAIVIIFTL